MSAGLKGLRVSTGPAGTFLNAGRGGLYYREKLNSGSVPLRNDDAVQNAPPRPSVVLWWICAPIAAAIWLSAPSLTGFLVFVGIFGAWAVTNSVVSSRRRRRIQEEAAERKRLWETFWTELKKISETGDLSDLTKLTAARVAGPFFYSDVEDLAFAAIVKGIAHAGEASDLGLEKMIRAFDQIVEALGVSARHEYELRLRYFRALTWQFLSDQELDTVEEKLLERFRAALRIKSDDVVSELHALEQFKTLRDIDQSSLPASNVSVKLQRGEVCHYVTSGDLIEKKTVRTWVEFGERQKEEDWVVDRSGDIYVTSKRVLIVGDGTLSISHNEVLDVEVDTDSERVEIIKDGRKTPYYLRVREPILIGGLIERAAGLVASNSADEEEQGEIDG